MKTSTLALLLLSATTAWAQVDTIVPIHPPELMAQGKTADMASAKIFPLAGDDLVPQMANGELGGGQIFFMEWRIQNITNAQATVDIDYFDSDGDPMAVPSREPDGTIQSFIGISAVVPANGIRYGGTWPFEAPVQLGYARVISNPPGAVVVTGLYNT